MKKFFGEFKAFISRGNIVDMAFGVIVGGAFSTIATSFNKEVMMPILGMFLGGIDFSSWVVELPNLYGGDPIPMYLGNFINNCVTFLIIAFCVFLMMKALNAMKKKEEEKPAAPAAPPADIVLLTEIRDLLKK